LSLLFLSFFHSFSPPIFLLFLFFWLKNPFHSDRFENRRKWDDSVTLDCR
jgi:hypothetical protein